MQFTQKCSDDLEIYTQCSTGAGEAPPQFLSSLVHFGVNRAIHPFLPKIDKNWFCSLPRVSTGPIYASSDVLSFCLVQVTS